MLTNLHKRLIKVIKSYFEIPLLSSYFVRHLQSGIMIISSALNTPADYVPVAIQFVVALGFAVTVIALTQKLGPRLRSKKKEKPFESGIKSIGDARQRFAIKYFLVAILFVLFDVEVVFMYPWAVNFKDWIHTMDTASIWAMASMLSFIIFVLIGFFYIIKKKALDWE